MDALKEFIEANKTIVFAVIGIVVLFVGKNFLSKGGGDSKTVTRQLSRPGEGPSAAMSMPASAPSYTPPPPPTTPSAGSQPAASTSPAIPAFQGYPEISQDLDPKKYAATASFPRTLRNPFKDFKRDRTMDSAAVQNIAQAESEINRVSGEYSDAISKQREMVAEELIRPKALLAEAKEAYGQQNFLKASIVAQRSANAVKLINQRVGVKVTAEVESTSKINITSIAYKYKGYYDLGEGPIGILEKTVLSPDLRGGRSMAIMQVKNNDKLDMASLSDEGEKSLKVEAIHRDRIVLSHVNKEGEKVQQVHYLQNLGE